MQTGKAIRQNGRMVPGTRDPGGQGHAHAFQDWVQEPGPRTVDTPWDWHYLTQKATSSPSFSFASAEAEVWGR